MEVIGNFRHGCFGAVLKKKKTVIMKRVKE